MPPSYHCPGFLYTERGNCDPLKSLCAEAFISGCPFVVMSKQGMLDEGMFFHTPAAGCTLVEVEGSPEE
jgi:hypothetical protein